MNKIISAFLLLIINCSESNEQKNAYSDVNYFYIINSKVHVISNVIFNSLHLSSNFKNSTHVRLRIKMYEDLRKISESAYELYGQIIKICEPNINNSVHKDIVEILQESNFVGDEKNRTEDNINNLLSNLFDDEKNKKEDNLITSPEVQFEKNNTEEHINISLSNVADVVLDEDDFNNLFDTISTYDLDNLMNMESDEMNTKEILGLLDEVKSVEQKDNYLRLLNIVKVLEEEESIHTRKTKRKRDLKKWTMFHELTGQGEDKASTGRFPFIVSIHLNGRFLCSGSMLSRTHAITSARGIKEYKEDNNDTLSIRAGSEYTDRGGLVIPVWRVTVHPDFHNDTFQHDLAMLELSQQVSLDGKRVRVRRIDLERSKSALLRDNITIFGWGDRKGGTANNVSELMAHSELIILNLDDCADKYSMKMVSENNLCVGFVSGQEGACYDTIGAPVVAGSKLVGVASVTPPHCVGPHTPTILTHIGFYADWIDSVLQQETDRSGQEDRTTIRKPTAKLRSAAEGTKIISIDEVDKFFRIGNEYNLREELIIMKNALNNFIIKHNNLFSKRDCLDEFKFKSLKEKDETLNNTHSTDSCNTAAAKDIYYDVTLNSDAITTTKSQSKFNENIRDILYNIKYDSASLYRNKFDFLKIPMNSKDSNQTNEKNVSTKINSFIKGSVKTVEPKATDEKISDVSNNYEDENVEKDITSIEFNPEKGKNINYMNINNLQNYGVQKFLFEASRMEPNDLSLSGKSPDSTYNNPFLPFLPLSRFGFL